MILSPLSFFSSLTYAPNTVDDASFIIDAIADGTVNERTNLPSRPSRPAITGGVLSTANSIDEEDELTQMYRTALGV